MLSVVLLLAAGADAGPAVRLAVRPAAEPRPALRYHLLPEVRERTPGNPVQWYVRCFAEQRNFYFGKEAVAERARLRRAPLAELAKVAYYSGSATTQADWGARLDALDWQAADRVRAGGPDAPFPELGSFRRLAEALQVRFRCEVARGEWDTAVGTAKTMFALARHLGEHPMLAGNRIGLEVAGLALDTLEEFVQQPGAPNLFWALTDLPSPLVEVRTGAQGDRLAADTLLDAIHADRTMTPAEVDEAVGRLAGRAGQLREAAGRPPRSFRAAFAARAKDVDRVKTTRVRLLLAGDLAAAGASPEQIALVAEKRAYEARRDDELKRLAVAPWQLGRLPPVPPAGELLFADLLAPVADARREQLAVDRRVAVLRHVEALRMHAAAHGGALPDSPDAVALPLPADPLTNTPFGYAVEGTTARLTGPATAHADAVRYEVAVRK